MPSGAWDFLRDFTAALSRCHKRERLPQRLGEALGPRWRACAVRLIWAQGEKLTHIEAKRSGGQWRSERYLRNARGWRASVEARLVATRRERVLVLPLRDRAAELRILFAEGGEGLIDEPAFLATLQSAAEGAVGQQEVIDKLSELSRRAHTDLQRMRSSVTRAPLVAVSSAMRSVVERAHRVARYETAVLLQGEAGSGKERLAREIHRRSRRSRFAFVSFRCRSTPSEFLGREIFGAEEGEGGHLGSVELADGGILYLADIDTLPAELQAKLLRLLQEGRFARTGSTQERRADVRLIASSRRDLGAMVRAGEFNEELYYRLHAFALRVPPLRERGEDLAALCRDLLGDICQRHQIESVPALPADNLLQLQRHAFPGNLRELASLLESALIVGEGHRLVLPSELSEPPKTTPHADAIRPLDASIRQAIEIALRETGGKIYGDDGAAHALDLHPATLQSKMRKLGIDRAAFVS